jgi:hypothetical protein
MCGSAKIDGYAFCLGLESLEGLYETHKDLQGPIRSIIYLIRGAIFRPKYTSSRSGMDSLGICSLGELIDMYHTHKATELHDKVYALLGMSSVDGSIVSLSPNYGVLWEDLLQQLVKILLHEQVSVDVGPKKAMAVIRSKGHILGQVSSVKSDITRDSRQSVIITFKNIPERLRHNQIYAHWTLKVSAKQVREGDIVCLLQGTLKPVIVRPCEDYFAVIRIAAFPEDRPTESSDIEWSKYLQSITVFPRDFLLVWDWTEKLDLGEYENLIRTNGWMSEHSETRSGRHLDKVTRMWNFALILEDLGEYEGAEVRLREAIQSYEMALGEEHLHALESQYSRTLWPYAAWNLNGAVVNVRKLLWLAARGGHKVVFRLLLDTGKVDINSMDENGQTLLSWAAKGGRLDIVERLLQEKAEVNAVAVGVSGRTALQAAAEGGHLAVVERLLQEKAEVNAAAADNSGRTALQAAAEGGHLAIVKCLRHAGARE